MNERRSGSKGGRSGGDLDPKEEGDGWEEIWILKKKEMDGRRSGS